MPSLLDNLPHRCTIRRRVETVDELGGLVGSITVEQTDVPCWEQAATAKETSDFRQKGMSVDRTIYFKDDPQVTAAHEIIITARSGNTIAAIDRITLSVEAVRSQHGPGGLRYFEVITNEYTTAT